MPDESLLGLNKLTIYKFCNHKQATQTNRTADTGAVKVIVNTRNKLAILLCMMVNWLYPYRVRLHAKYTVGHKKRGSKLLSITMANLNRF